MSKAIALNPMPVFTGYQDLLALYQRKAKETPKGVSLKLQNNKHLLLQFVFPDTGKRSTKACGVSFTESGVLEALDKAWKVSDALKRFELASEFWTWYDVEILEKNEIRNDLKTYRVIFEEFESQYFNGRHKNTGEKRDPNNPSCKRSYFEVYERYFKSFPNWDKLPEWDDFKAVLSNYKQGTKSFRECCFRLKQIANKCPKVIGQKLIEQLETLDIEQTEFKERQSIDIDSFLNWWVAAYQEIETIEREPDREARRAWLWVAACQVVYGLRPTEVLASLNLFQAVTDKQIKQAWGVKGKKLGLTDQLSIPALNDKNNKELLLVLGNNFYVGKDNLIPISIKTGGRIVAPLVTDKRILELLKIQSPCLPSYSPRSSESVDPTAFSRNYQKRLISYKCPVTQAYALRHLANQLGEKYGIPSEIRARSLGHSVAVNDSVYKARSNIKTTVDLLTNHSKQPLSLDLAKHQLEATGFNLDDPSVQAILKIIYQVETI